jgi:hypothetical protein
LPLEWHRWLKEPKPVSELQLVVDASEVASAGCLLNKGQLEQAIQVPFTDAQIVAVQQD